MYRAALRPAWVEIDLDALEFNIHSIQKKIGPDTDLIGVIKADAYGHGALQTAQVLRECGVRTFAVATLAEGIRLREAGDHDDVIICLGLIPAMYAEEVVENDIIPAFCTIEAAEALNRAAQYHNKIARGIIAVDTGMGRIGYQWNDTENAAGELLRAQALPNFEIYGMFSHFSTADAPDLEFTFRQKNRYQHFLDAVTRAGVRVRVKTIANSAAIMRLTSANYDAMRAGIILYGLYPSHDVNPADLDIRPVMSVKANIVYLKKVGPNFSVGYGRRYISKEPAKIATLDVGYADGYPRPYSASGHVIINGRICPIAGNICMDQFMVDVTDLPDVKIGDEAILMGTDGTNSITADDIADATGTINYEITCAFGQRLPKVFVRKKK